MTFFRPKKRRYGNGLFRLDNPHTAVTCILLGGRRGSVWKGAGGGVSRNDELAAQEDARKRESEKSLRSPAQFAGDLSYKRTAKSGCAACSWARIAGVFFGNA